MLSSEMPEFHVVLKDPTGVIDDVSLVVKLNKVPRRGSWFDLGAGVPAQAKEIRMIGGEKVIFAHRDTEPGLAS
jgi:hypothetical protein